jgi:Bacterial regulatory helix-turn-helix protein, lysR family
MYNQNVELRHLRYFVAVAEELNFSRAAEKLQMAQSPLSQQIRQLERILEVRLFEHNHHIVTLTNAGGTPTTSSYVTNSSPKVRKHLLFSLPVTMQFFR